MTTLIGDKGINTGTALQAISSPLRQEEESLRKTGFVDDREVEQQVTSTRLDEPKREVLTLSSANIGQQTRNNRKTLAQLRKDLEFAQTQLDEIKKRRETTSTKDTITKDEADELGLSVGDVDIDERGQISLTPDIDEQLDDVSKSIIQAQNETDRRIDSLFEDYEKSTANFRNSPEGLAIRASFDRLRKEARDFSRQMIKQHKRFGARFGTTRFAPTTATGVISGEEKALIDTLVGIDSAESIAIINALNAEKDRRFDLMNLELEQVEKARKEKIDTMRQLQTKLEERKAEMEEKLIKQSQQNAIIGLKQQGVENAGDIFNLLDGGVSLETIKETLEAVEDSEVLQKFKVDTLKNASLLNAPIDVRQAILEANSLAEVVSVSGNFGVDISDQKDLLELEKLRKEINEPSIDFKTETSLRKEFNSTAPAKELDEVEGAFSSVARGVEDWKGSDTSAGKGIAEQAIIRGFVRMTDPGSVVREGEFAISTEGQSIVNSLRGKVEASIRGGVGLTENEIDSIQRVSSRLMKDYIQRYNEEVLLYRNNADRQKVNPDYVANYQNTNKFFTPEEAEIGTIIIDNQGIPLKKISDTEFEELESSEPEEILEAIGKVESQGDYSAIGPETTSGERAYGKYQVMDFNIPNWTREILGREMTPQEFLNNPEAQDKVALGKISSLYDKYKNPRDVAAVWFSGQPYTMDNLAADVTGTNVPTYVAAVINNM